MNHYNYRNKHDNVDLMDTREPVENVGGIVKKINKCMPTD